MVQAIRIDSDIRSPGDDSSSDNNTVHEMEKQLKIWQFLLGVLGVSITLISALISQSNKIETQRLRIEFLESTARDHGILIKDISQQNTARFEKIDAKLTDILVTMQNKADRSKK